jgi:hypothetical protein
MKIEKFVLVRLSSLYTKQDSVPDGRENNPIALVSHVSGDAVTLCNDLNGMRYYHVDDLDIYEPGGDVVVVLGNLLVTRRPVSLDTFKNLKPTVYFLMANGIIENCKEKERFNTEQDHIRIKYSEVA